MHTATAATTTVIAISVLAAAAADLFASSSQEVVCCFYLSKFYHLRQGRAGRGGARAAGDRDRGLPGQEADTDT